MKEQKLTQLFNLILMLPEAWSSNVAFESINIPLRRDALLLRLESVLRREMKSAVR